MILMVPDDCVTSGDNLHWMVDPEKSKRMAVCYNGHTFFVGFPTFSGYTSSDNPRGVKLWALPGGENDIMDGERWGGLTLKDIVISVYEGYRMNGYKNGATVKLSDAVDVKGAKTEAILGNGVRTPGYVPIPICTEGRLWSEAKHLFENSLEALFKNPDKAWDGGSYPCGEGILSKEEKAAFKF
ncbi:hypothetical protein G7Z17_g1835 [Cylindrodendrum hubeiense]|uniref:Uncharacterized protein n=1 Tax=Cylindrodendrum hubeiense TaxID=595255 RepID=A0A9P5HHT8_9HYPO|nr:hypothetical protein G7Z17_g1835 [Cylindrodendrum hubeiense]